MSNLILYPPRDIVQAVMPVDAARPDDTARDLRPAVTTPVSAEVGKAPGTVFLKERTAVLEPVSAAAPAVVEALLDKPGADWRRSAVGDPDLHRRAHDAFDAADALNAPRTSYADVTA